MAGPPSYRHGRIVWAYLRSNLTAKREAHPAIILDRTGDIVQPERFDPRKMHGDNTVHVIGVSTKHKKYKFPYIQLPFAASGHATTKLKVDSGAIVGWYARLAIPDDVIGFGGEVPDDVMTRIDQAVRQDLVKRIGKQFETLRQTFEELLGED